MSKDYETEAKYVTLISRIRILSKEGQKKVIKSILLGDVLSDYSEGTSKEEANKAIDSLLDILYGDDVELRSRIIKEFVDDFDSDVSMIKEEICDHNHDYSEWETVEGDRPVFDEDGDVKYYGHGAYFERKCKYCGMVQKEYSVYDKEHLEEDQKYWAKKHPKKLINIPKKENTEN